MIQDLETLTDELAGLNFNSEAWLSAMPSGYNRAQIARVLGVTDSNLLSIEKGRSKPSLILAVRYSKLTGVPVEQFVSTPPTGN